MSCAFGRLLRVVWSHTHRHFTQGGQCYLSQASFFEFYLTIVDLARGLRLMKMWRLVHSHVAAIWATRLFEEQESGSKVHVAGARVARRPPLSKRGTQPPCSQNCFRLGSEPRAMASFHSTNTSSHRSRILFGDKGSCLGEVDGVLLCSRVPKVVLEKRT